MTLLKIISNSLKNTSLYVDTVTTFFFQNLKVDMPILTCIFFTFN